MAALLLGRLFQALFHSDASNHTNFPRRDLNVPSNSPATQMHSPSSPPCSGSSTPSHMVTPEQVTSSSAIPINELLFDSELPRSIESNSKSKQLEPSTTSKSKNYNPFPSQNIYRPSTIHFHPALVLQNKGSVARDHLASERTFLAYVRTSLGMASAGVALVQLFTMADLFSKSTGVPLPVVNQKLQKFAAPLGLSAIAMSIIVLLLGELLFIFHDWFQTHFLKVLIGISWYSTLFRRISSQLPAYLLCSSLLASVRLQPLPLEPFWVGRFNNIIGECYEEKRTTPVMYGPRPRCPSYAQISWRKRNRGIKFVTFQVCATGRHLQSGCQCTIDNRMYYFE